MVVKNNKISFTNNMFEHIFHKGIDKNNFESEVDYLGLRVFKVFREELMINSINKDLSSATNRSHRVFKKTQQNTKSKILLTLRDLIKNPPEYFVDKIFCLDISIQSSGHTGSQQRK